MTSYALVNLSTGRVSTFLRPDLPTGYAAPEGYTLVPDDQLPEGWQREEASPAPLRQATDIVLDRLTDAEIDALTGPSAPIFARRAWLAATSTGLISESDPRFPQLTAALDAAGIIAASRWQTLLAP